jgi:hypothetical protein
MVPDCDLDVRPPAGETERVVAAQMEKGARWAILETNVAAAVHRTRHQSLGTVGKRGSKEGIKERGKPPRVFHKKPKGDTEIDTENAGDFPSEKIMADNRAVFGENEIGRRDVVGHR